MKPKTRFINSVIKTAKEEQVTLPYQRGAQRLTFISRRAKPQAMDRKSA